jgi:hypothetical protein
LSPSPSLPPSTEHACSAAGQQVKHEATRLQRIVSPIMLGAVVSRHNEGTRSLSTGNRKICLANFLGWPASNGVFIDKVLYLVHPVMNAICKTCHWISLVRRHDTYDTLMRSLET